MTLISIYAHVEAHLPREGPGLAPGGDVLPDEPEAEEERVVRIAPGLSDHVVDPGTELWAEQTASSLIRPFAEAAGASAAGAPYARLYDRLVAIEQLGFLEPFVRRVIESRLPRRNVRSVALRLVSDSTDRLPVKVGIALLGVCARRPDQRILLTIARHPEFTDYAGMALTNAFGSRDDVLWELAKVVQDWGRVALVRQLASTNDPRIKSWILRQPNEDYLVLLNLALVVAESGGLRTELEADEIDDELCRAAGSLLQQLIENRSFERESIDDYADAPEAVRIFLSHLTRRAERLESIEPLMTIIDYLELGGGVSLNVLPEFRAELVARIADRPLPGWSDGERTRAATFARWVLQRPGWRRAIEEGLRSDDSYAFYLAERAATRLGDDVFPVLLDRLRRDPDEDEITWGDAVRAADEAGFDDLLEVASMRLSEHRPSQDWRFAGWLRAILEGLERFPGKGWPLIRDGLMSGEMMERRFGIHGLRTFGGVPWPPDAVGLLEAVVRSDPDDDNREMGSELLEDHGDPGRVSTP